VRLRVRHRFIYNSGEKLNRAGFRLQFQQSLSCEEDDNFINVCILIVFNINFQPKIN